MATKKAKKKARNSEVQDVTPSENQEQNQETTASEPASDDAEREVEPTAAGATDCAPVAEAPADVAESDPASDAPTSDVVTDDEPRFPVGVRDLSDIGHELAQVVADKNALEAEKASVMKDYGKRIGVLDARVSELASDYRAAERPESYDYKRGVRYVWDGLTRMLVDTIQLPRDTPIERRATDTIGNAPITVVDTFSQLVTGKVWEHSRYGVLRIEEVLDSKVRCTSEDLDEPDIEIGRGDWANGEAHPREVPDVVIGQRWTLDDSDMMITALDDVAACVMRYAGPEDLVGIEDRVSRLSFCSVDAKCIDPVDGITLDRLQVGTRVDDGCGAFVEVKAVVEGETEASILIEHEDSGDQEQVTLEWFQGAKIAPAREEPKKSKRGKKARQSEATA